MVMFKKLVTKGAGNIKKQIMHNQKLLPTLTTRNIYSQITQQTHQFHKVNNQLTNSMLFFHQNISQNLQNTDMGQIVRIQTDKCYKHIPKCYFQQEIDEVLFNKLITRDKRKVNALRQDLTDYKDQVEFNVNQQVTYKIRIFMSFVSFLTSIGKLADLSLSKIKRTRTKNLIIKEIIFKKGLNVNRLRARKEEIQKTIAILEKVKKLRKIQEMFMGQVSAKGKISSLSFYPDYCILHQQIKQYCCPKMLCKFWDVAYYIERGYQDSFCRSLKSYLTEIVTIDEKQIKQIVFPNKSAFSTLDNHTNFTSFADPSMTLDQSFEMDEDEVELVSKHNIQREIVSIYKQGLHKCSYSTDQICQELTQTLKNCESRLYRAIRGDNPELCEKQLTNSQKKQTLQKLITHKYVKIVEHWSERMKKIAKRQFAIIERALRATSSISEDHPQKYEIMCSYLMQILYITLGFIDESLSYLISTRKFKQQQSESIKQILLYEEQWKELIIELKYSHSIWEQLKIHFNLESIQESQVEGRLLMDWLDICVTREGRSQKL